MSNRNRSQRQSRSASSVGSWSELSSSTTSSWVSLSSGPNSLGGNAPTILRSSPTACSVSNPVAPPAEESRKYIVHSPQYTGTVQQWFRAAPLTQGVAGASVRRIDSLTYQYRTVHLSASDLPLNPPPIVSLGRNEEGIDVVFNIAQLPTDAQRYWVVPVGLSPGIYVDWPACKSQVHGVRGSVYQSYPSYTLAVNAWWDLYLSDAVRVVLPGGGITTSGSRPAQLTLAQLQINPQDYQKFYTDVCVKGDRPRAIVVFVGLKTGVFKDWLSCSHYVLHQSCAVFNRFKTLEGANQAFEAALNEGLVYEIVY